MLYKAWAAWLAAAAAEGSRQAAGRRGLQAGEKKKSNWKTLHCGKNKILKKSGCSVKWMAVCPSLSSTLKWLAAPSDGTSEQRVHNKRAYRELNSFPPCYAEEDARLLFTWGTESVQRLDRKITDMEEYKGAIEDLLGLTGVERMIEI